ncbi:MAG: hypothetical protein R3B72_31160 [Polyangiaceae bacterium]
MLFSLEAVQADHGDALLVHYGPADDPKLILVDAGPNDVWEDWMKPRLEQYRELRGLTGPVPIHLTMVSHMDRDHITGVLKMVRDAEARDAAGKPQLVELRALWHNTFDDILSTTQVSSIAALQAFFSSADAATIASLGGDVASAMIAGDIQMGKDLADIADSLGITINGGFDKGVVQAPKTIKLGPETTLTVLGPHRRELELLEQEWDHVRGEAAGAPEPEKHRTWSSFLDASVHNLASLVVIIEQGKGQAKKSMLLTGDARGDFIMSALRKAKRLPASGGSVTFDILKIPHHGSDRNVSKAFFETVRAKNYVFSGDGTVGSNPDIKTVRWLNQARGAASYSIYFTNRLDKLVEHFARDQADNTRSYEVIYRDDDEWSTWIDLGEPLEI